MKQQSEYTEHQIDMADADLQKIVDDKLELQQFIDSLHHRHDLKDQDFNLMRLVMEENFDEAFTPLWRKCTQTSGSIGWPKNIPPFGTLSFVTPQQRADREWAINNRIVPTNPATRTHYEYPRGE